MGASKASVNTFHAASKRRGTSPPEPWSAGPRTKCGRIANAWHSRAGGCEAIKWRSIRQPEHLQ
ncbi:Uncharacterized protein MLTONO_p0019 (plasmid) [Mesorhizobium loti]|nr:Uncharacterized protein MLTONO_p0019 [Mesorhizobium loti]BCH04847.1 hypothetical protein MesoLj131b_68460 [Mesorhizobium sp. 131-2-5]